MARVQVPITVLDTTGAPISGASVRVQFRAGGADATLYSGESGGSTTTNPTSTDSVGRVQAWVDRGAYNAVISGTGFTTYTQPFDAAPAADASVDNLWIPSDVIDDRELDPANITSFLKLAVAADRKVDFGNIATPPAFGGANRMALSVAHGLGVVPAYCWAMAGYIGGPSTSTGQDECVVVSLYSKDATNINFKLALTNGATSSVGASSFFWLAIV